MSAATGAAPAGAAPDVLRRAAGLQLLGELPGSGYRVPPALVRRADGQVLQLTPLLLAVLEAVDGECSLDEVAARVAERTGRPVTGDNVRTLVDSQLRPLGLLVRPDGSEPELKRADPLLGLRLRRAVTDPQRTRRLTAPFAALFSPLVAVPVLAAFAFVCWWVFVEKGLASATSQAFRSPGLLLLVLVVTVLSAGFHEFGHAAAARRGGATPGVMGVGLYLVWPAFYTDVTDSYRLGRGGRIRTDLGGLYFNAIVAVAVAGIWWLTSYDALLLVVATQVLQMVRQLTPLVRFDGYHVLADLTGVPDLFARIGPTLRGALPWRWGDPEARLLKPWARAVVTTWVLVVVPVLLVTAALLVLALPRVLGTAWAALADEQRLLAAAWADGDPLASAGHVGLMALVVLPVLAVGLLLGRLVRSVVRGTWRRTEGRPARRALAGLAGVLVLGLLAAAWWPDRSTYRPIEPDERGTLLDAVAAAPGPAPVAPRTAPVLAEGEVGTARAVWDQAEPLPPRDRARLAVVLLPRGEAAADEPGTLGSDDAPAWVFPFDKPLAPGPGDNQALAVNTEDGTIEYDVAFALVWAAAGESAVPVNEAYAFASCTGCAAVAVGFQVVLVVGDSPVVAPQNLAGALTSDCVGCLTYALAQQLFVTLDGPLSEAAMAQLDTLWAQIAAYGATLEEVPLEEVAAQLDTFETEILAIIEADRPGTVPSATATPSGSATGEPSPAPSFSASPSGSASPTASATPGSSVSPSPATTSGTPGATPSPSPTGTTAAPPSPSG